MLHLERKHGWEQEWEQLEQEKEEAAQKHAAFKRQSESEQAAFYAMLEQERQKALPIPVQWGSRVSWCMLYGNTGRYPGVPFRVE